MADITMPQLGETVTEGTITKWMKQVGDKVEEDEVLFEVSTDKVDSEVPSPTSGYLSEILVQEGETVDVGAKLAVISDQPAGDGDGKTKERAEEKEEKEEKKEQEDEEPEAEEQPDDEATERASKAEAGGATEEEASEGAVGDERAQEAPARRSASRRPADSRPAGRPASGGGGRVLSPVVRRLIAEHDLDPDQIEGTGAGGRITRDDVLKVIDGGAAPSPPRAADTAVPDAPAEPAAPKPAPASTAKAGEGDEIVPFTNIRKRTAEHMVRSLDTSAHTLVVIEVDYENVDKVRAAVKDRFREDEGFGLSYLPFISRAVIDAIRDFPHVNASVGEGELVVHRYVNLGIAVDLDFQGLIVPVVHDADTKRLRALAREIADLASRARGKKLGADDISGGTFTITNPGGYGTFLTAPIINQPQVAILSTDGVKMKPVAVDLGDGTWAIAVHPVGSLAIAFDHRAYDGAYASAFLAKLKEILETRDWAQEL